MLTNPQILSVYKTAEKAIRKTAASFGAFVSPDALADMQQGTLERMLESFDPSKGAPDALAWRIAANVCTDYLRGRTTSAIRNQDVSLTVRDDDGKETSMDLADDSCNPFEMIAARQLDGEMTRAIADLSDAQKAGIRSFYASDDETMTGADRIAKMRAVDALADSLKASHFAVKAGKAGKAGKRAKVAKRAKVEETETETADAPPLLKLRTLATWEATCSYLMGARLVVA